MTDYVHGYSAREMERLGDQAQGLSDLLHHDTAYPQGARVLEAGCGVGAQTLILAARSPGARFTSVDISEESLAVAQARVAAAGHRNVEFEQADVMALRFPTAGFDHVFVCFLLEHLPDPRGALRELLRVLKPGGTMTVIEGDHGSCTFWPETPEALRAWRCLIEVQAALGGDSLIGRRLYPLLVAAGLAEVRVSPRMVYADAGRPGMQEAFVRKIIIPMVEGVEQAAREMGLMSEAAWEKGLRDLHVTGHERGAFCYTFFKGTGRK